MAIEIASLVAALGGQVVGKIRLQKIVYLLDMLGLESEFSYAYHHYGPYSSELSETTDVEKLFGELREEQRNRASDGVPYAIYKTDKKLDDVVSIGGLSVSEIKRYAAIMDQYSATELELAATAYWLVNEEKLINWRDELKRRKGIKIEQGRQEKAIELLDSLELTIPY